MSVSVGQIGLFHLTPAADIPARGSLISKDFGPSRPLMRRGPTLVQGSTLSALLGEGVEVAPATTRTRPPNAHQRRAACDKAERHQRRRANFLDSVAFAAFRRWPLELSITATWDRCVYGDRRKGHVLALPDRERAARLRGELWRLHHRAGLPFACTWVRDVGGGYGPHIHLGLWWALPISDLVGVLARLTGSPPSPDWPPRGTEARSECRGWLIKRNTARNPLRGAMGWGQYQLDQEPRHLIVPNLEGKSLSVSRDLDINAIAPFRPEFEAWKAWTG